MRRLARAALRLYPRWWRRRYGAELQALVEDLGDRPGMAADLARGALSVRLRKRSLGAAADSWGVLWRPSAVAPVLMSLGALGAVAGHLVTVGTAPQADEGTAAHVWQLLMAGQLPVVAWFALRQVSEHRWRALAISALHAAAFAAAVFPVWWLAW